jgi:6-phosphogluconolactonase
LNEAEKWVGAVYVEKFAAWRISITYPIINAAANVFVIVAGAGKSNIVKEVLASDSIDTSYPVQQVQPSGELVWYLDAAAAELLPLTLMTEP